jgi:hypothetical protein
MRNLRRTPYLDTSNNSVTPRNILVPDLDADGNIDLTGSNKLDSDFMQINSGSITAPSADDPIPYNHIVAAVAAEGAATADAAGTIGSVFNIGPKSYAIVEDGTADPELDQIDAGTDADSFAAAIATKVTADTAQNHCTGDATAADISFTVNDAGAAGDTMELSSDDPALDLTAFSGGSDEVATPKVTSPAELGGIIGTSLIAASIVNGDTTHAPDGNSVFDALALKATALTGCDTLLSSTQATTNVGTKQALYIVPVGKKCIPTKVVVRTASTSLAAMGDSLLCGFGGSGGGNISFGSASLAQLTDATVALMGTNGSTNPDAFSIGNAADVFGAFFNDPSITGTVQIDVFGYIY